VHFDACYSTILSTHRRKMRPSAALQAAEPFAWSAPFLSMTACPSCRTAHGFGIGWLRAVRRPDSAQPAQVPAPTSGGSGRRLFDRTRVLGRRSRGAGVGSAAGRAAAPTAITPSSSWWTGIRGRIAAAGCHRRLAGTAAPPRRHCRYGLHCHFRCHHCSHCAAGTAAPATAAAATTPAGTVRVSGAPRTARPSAAARAAPPATDRPRRPFAPHGGRRGGHVGQIDDIDGRARNLVTDVLLDIRQRDRVFLATETDASPSAPRARFRPMRCT